MPTSPASKSGNVATIELALVDKTKPIDLEKMSAAQMSNGCSFGTDELVRRAKAMLDHIEELKTERAMKAILAGLLLIQLKKKLPHGEFEACKAKHFTKSRRMVIYYIQLSETFSRSAKLMLPEFVASQQLSLQLEAPKGAAQAFKRKLVKFVGDLGVTDLLRRHGILKRGGKRTKSAGGAGGTGDQPSAASLSPGAQAYQQMVDAVNHASVTLLNEVRWSLMTPEVAAQVEPLVKKLQSDFHNRLLQARHEAK